MNEQVLCVCGCGQPVPPKIGDHGGSPRQYATRNCKVRAYRRRRREDPDRAEHARKVMQRQQRAYKERLRRDPDKWREFRARDKRNHQAYIERLRQDAQRWVAHREQERIRYALRQERKGRPLRARYVTPRYQAEENVPRLPVVPLLAWIEKRIRRVSGPEGLGHRAPVRSEGPVCEDLGIDPRYLSAWRTGERDMVNFDTVDRVLTNAGVLWWEVYDPDEFPGEYEQAKAVFEPDEDLEAA